MFTLDIRNAFNTARWDRILEALIGFSVPAYLVRIIRSYFSDRVLLCESSEAVYSHQVTGGVPQGSVLDPLLWNTMYDGILRVPLVGRREIVGFADDVALLVVDKHPGKAEEMCNQNIRAIEHWLSSMGIGLAPEKTEAVLIRKEGSGDGHCRIRQYLGVLLSGN